MSKKIMNTQRWRLLAFVAAINIGVFVLCYFTLPEDKRSGLLVVMLALLPVGLIGLAIIIALWRRFPVAAQEEKGD
jgi:hypothetical protein